MTARAMAAKPKATAVARPAETGAGVAGAVVVVIAALLNVTDPAILGAMILIVGFIPAAITWLVNTIKK